MLAMSSRRAPAPPTIDPSPPCLPSPPRWDRSPEDQHPPPTPLCHHPLRRFRVVSLASLASLRLRSLLHLKLRLLNGSPLSRLRSHVYLIVAVTRLRFTLPRLRARRLHVLHLLQQDPDWQHSRRRSRHILRSRALSILFVATISVKIRRNHTQFSPLRLALDIISDARKVKLDHALNAGKCSVLLELFSYVENYLNIMRFVLDNLAEIKLTQVEGHSGCYYMVKDLCRLLMQCKQYIVDCTGYLPDRKVFAKVESVSTINRLVLDLNKCFRLLVLRFERLLDEICSDPVQQEFRWERTPPNLPGLYLGFYLQLQAKKDLTHVLSELKQSRAKSFWPSSFLNWQNKLTAREESALTQQLILRLSYDKGQGNEVEFLKEGLFVDKRYVKVVRFLGAGTYGKVEEVLCFGEKYAMKTIYGICDFQTANEAIIQAQLQHPNIVKLVWYTSNFEKENTLSILMELMAMDLETFIEQQVRSIRGPLLNYPLVSLHIVLQIAKAMKYLHAQGIMHRDLKAANVMVDFSWSPDAFKEGYIHVKVADFGLSKVKRAGSMHTRSVGTKYWRAPEVFMHDPATSEDPNESSSDLTRYTFSADVYSFSMTCYEILTGKKPFADHSNMSNWKERIAVRNERPDLPEGLHSGLKDLITRCWEGRPESRPSFDQICQELEALKEDLIFGSIVARHPNNSTHH